MAVPEYTLTLPVVVEDDADVNTLMFPVDAPVPVLTFTLPLAPTELPDPSVSAPVVPDVVVVPVETTIGPLFALVVFPVAIDTPPLAVLDAGLPVAMFTCVEDVPVLVTDTVPVLVTEKLPAPVVNEALLEASMANTFEPPC